MEIAIEGVDSAIKMKHRITMKKVVIVNCKECGCKNKVFITFYKEDFDKNRKGKDVDHIA